MSAINWDYVSTAAFWFFLLNVAGWTVGVASKQIAASIRRR